MNTLQKQAILTTAKAAGLPAEKLTAILAVIDDRARTVVEEGCTLLSQAQKARQLGVSRFTIRKLVHLGKLRPVELLPGLFRFRKEDGL